MLPVASNQALFSVIGTTYGGDETTFALPNVQGVVSAPSTLTPEPDVPGQPLQPQLIKKQQFKKQAIKKQVIRQQGVEEPPTEDPTAGTPLLACIALEGVLPSDPAASPLSSRRPKSHCHPLDDYVGAVSQAVCRSYPTATLPYFGRTPRWRWSASTHMRPGPLRHIRWRSACASGRPWRRRVRWWRYDRRGRQALFDGARRPLARCPSE
jgi:hypothetical protein